MAFHEHYLVRDFLEANCASGSYGKEVIAKLTPEMMDNSALVVGNSTNHRILRYSDASIVHDLILLDIIKYEQITESKQNFVHGFTQMSSTIFNDLYNYLLRKYGIDPDTGSIFNDELQVLSSVKDFVAHNPLAVYVPKLATRLIQHEFVQSIVSDPDCVLTFNPGLCDFANMFHDLHPGRLYHLKMMLYMSDDLVNVVVHESLNRYDTPRLAMYVLTDLMDDKLLPETSYPIAYKNDCQSMIQDAVVAYGPNSRSTFSRILSRYQVENKPNVWYLRLPEIMNVVTWKVISNRLIEFVNSNVKRVKFINKLLRQDFDCFYIEPYIYIQPTYKLMDVLETKIVRSWPVPWDVEDLSATMVRIYMHVYYTRPIGGRWESYHQILFTKTRKFLCTQELLSIKPSLKISISPKSKENYKKVMFQLLRNIRRIPPRPTKDDLIQAHYDVACTKALHYLVVGSIKRKFALYNQGGSPDKKKNKKQKMIDPRSLDPRVYDLVMRSLKNLKIKKQQKIREARDLKYQMKIPILDTIRSVDSLLDKAEDTIDECVENFSTTLSEVASTSKLMVDEMRGMRADVKRTVANGTEKVSDAASQLISQLKWLIPLLVFTVVAGALRIFDCSVRDILLTSSIAALLATVPLAYHSLLMPSFDAIKEFYSGRMKNQDGLVEHPVTKVFILILSIIAVGKAPTDISKWTNVVSNLPKLATSIESLCKWAVDLFEQGINFIRGTVLKLPPISLLQHDGTPESIWCENVKVLVAKDHAGTLAVNMETANEVFSLFLKGNDILARCPKNSALYNQVFVYQRMLMRLYPKFESIGSIASGPRAEPVCVYLMGSTGVGKSKLTIPIMVKVLQKTDPVRSKTLDLRDAIYVYPVDKFWEGYYQQKWVLFDEVGQLRESPGQEVSWALDIIKCVNTVPVQLKMAKAESKGVTDFRTDFCMLTSNLIEMRSEMIVCNEALARRMHLSYRVCPKVEFCTESTKGSSIENRRLDHNHPGLQNENGFNPDIYEFYPIEALTGKIIGPRITEIDVIVDQIVSLYKQRQHTFEAYNCYVTNLLRGLVNQNVNIGHRSWLFQRISNYYIRHFESHPDMIDLINEYIDDAVLAAVVDTPVDDPQALWHPDTFSVFAALRGHTLKKIPSRHSEDVDSLGSDDLYEFTFEDDLHPPQTWKNDFYRLLSKVWSGVDIAMSNVVASFDEIKAKSCKTVDDIKEYLKVQRLLDLLESGQASKMEMLVALSYVVKQKVVLYYTNLRAKYDRVINNYPVLSICVSLLPSISMIKMLLLSSAVSYGLFKYLRTKNELSSESKDWFKTTRSARSRKPNFQKLKRSTVNTNTFDYGDSNFTRENSKIVSEGSDDPVADSMVTTTLRNTYRIYNKSNDKLLGRCFFLCQRILVCPYHYKKTLQCAIDSKELDERSTLVFRRNGSNESFEISIRDFIGNGMSKDYIDRDIYYQQMPSHFPVHKSILNKLVSDEVIEKQATGNVLVAISAGDLTDRHYGRFEFTPQYNIEGDERFTALMYNVPTKYGDCGSLVFMVNPTIKGRICGFHVAGVDSKSFGCGAIFTLEDAQMICKYYDYTDTMSNQSGEIVRRLPTKVNVSRRNVVYKSELFGIFGPPVKIPCICKPMDLPDGTRVDPLQIASSKYTDTPNETPKPKYLMECVSSYYSQFTSAPDCTPFQDRRLLTFEEAVNGITGESGFGSINLNTSAGYPWCKPKKDVIGIHPLDFNSKPMLKLRGRVDDILSELRCEKRPDEYFIDTPKAELRKIEKVVNGKIRLISADSLPMMIVTRMLFGNLMLDFYKGAPFNGTLIGSSPHGSTWGTIAKLHKKVGLKSFDGDFKGFDTCFTSWLYEAFYEFYLLYQPNLSSLDQFAAKTFIMEHICNSWHISGDRVIQWHGPLPSGCGLTQVIGSFANQIFPRLMFCTLFQKPEIALPLFEDNVFVSACGDDNLLTVSDDLIDAFNQVTYSQFLGTLGFDYTTADKDLAFRPFKKLTDCSILSRGFAYCPEVSDYVGPLTLRTILEIPYWYRRRGFERVDMISCIDVFLRELSLHGEVTFNQYAPKLLELADSAYHYSPPIRSWYSNLLRTFNSDWFLALCSEQVVLDLSNIARVDVYSSGLVLGLDESSNEDDPDLLHISGKMSAPEDSVMTQSPVLREQSGLANNENNNGSSSITNSALVQAENTIETLNIKSDTAVNEKTLPKTQAPSRALLRDTAETRRHEILDFLKRPIRVHTGTWGLASGANTSLYSTTVMGALSSSQMWRDKVHGFLGFRGTACCRVQINAQKFQQGRLLLSYFPQPDWNPRREARSNMNLTLKTQKPRVELDCSTIQEAVLKVPYVSPTSYVNLVTGESGGFGRFDLSVYSPLVAPTGSNVVDYTVWIYFEDPELEFPAYHNFSGRISKSFRGEEKAMSEGPVSTGIRMATAPLGLFKDIPILGSIAKPLEWVGNTVAGVAGALGWSNPTLTSTASKFNRYSFPNMNNIDGVDNCVSLGLTQDNSVDVYPGHSGQDIDELHFSYINRIPAFIDSYIWNTSHGADHVILQNPVTPRYTSTSTVGALTLHSPCPMAYTANLFRYWRGSIKYNFKIVKTQFHSGRLMFTFYPGVNSSFVPSEVAGMNCYREVVDIQEANEFTVSVPFVAIRPWLETNNQLGAEYRWNTGYVVLSVLNPLVCPATVSTEVRILMEVSAGDDFELAMPETQPIFSPIEPNFEEQPEQLLEGSSEELHEQMDFGTDAIELPKKSNLEEGDSLIGGARDQDTSIDPHKLCIGEVCQSYRQLIKRSTTSRGISLVNTNVLQVSHRDMFIPTYYTNGVIPTVTTACVDYLDYTSGLFLYNRGSVRMRVRRWYYIGDWRCSAGYSSKLVGSDWYVNPVNLIRASLFETAPFNSWATGGVEVQQPHYFHTPTYLNLNRMNQVFNDNFGQQYVPDTALYFVSPTSFNDANYGPTIAARQAGDDFDFGFFIGCPQLVSSGSFDTNANLPLF